MKPILREEFWHDGRGPVLVRLRWGKGGRTLLAAEYVLPDYTDEKADLRHLRFVGVQVVQLVPEEVIDYGAVELPPGTDRAAGFDLGKSPWLGSFNPRHLGNCKHYRFRFYDELLDVICETVEAGVGPA